MVAGEVQVDLRLRQLAGLLALVVVVVQAKPPTLVVPEHQVKETTVVMRYLEDQILAVVVVVALPLLEQMVGQMVEVTEALEQHLPYLGRP